MRVTRELKERIQRRLRKKKVTAILFDTLDLTGMRIGESSPRPETGSHQNTNTCSGCIESSAHAVDYCK
jgi:hypothetical protein